MLVFQSQFRRLAEPLITDSRWSARSRLDAGLDLQTTRYSLVVIVGHGVASLDVCFNFHRCFPLFEIDCGKDCRLPIQAKKECEIAGREKILITPTKIFSYLVSNYPSHFRLY